MTKQKLRVGIAGYGIVGKRRRHFIDLHPALETTAVCDITFAGTGQLQDGTPCYKTYTELLASEKLDVLFVCMSNDVAAETARAGLERGLHVFCEKPPSRNIPELLSVLAVSRERPNLKLKYGFNHRYHGSVMDALKIVRDKELGDIVNLRGVYGKSKLVNYDDGKEWRAHRDRAGGGILLDQGVHMVDMLRLFAGEFTDIHSFISNKFWNFDVEDNAYALMRSERGVVALLHSSATQWRHRFHLEIALSRGTLVLAGILSGTKSYGAETLTVSWRDQNGNGDPREQRTSYNQDNSWREEIADFADAILTDRPIVDGSGTDALRTMQLVFQIYCADPEWKKKYGLIDHVPAEFSR